MFVVKDSGKDAVIEKGMLYWQKCRFEKFDEAVIYARHWLGEWDTLPTDWDGSPYDYSGGDTIYIVKED